MKATTQTPAIATAVQAIASNGMEPLSCGALALAASAQLTGPASRLATPNKIEVVFFLIMLSIILRGKLKAILSVLVKEM